MLYGMQIFLTFLDVLFMYAMQQIFYYCPQLSVLVFIHLQMERELKLIQTDLTIQTAGKNGCKKAGYTLIRERIPQSS